MNSLAEIFLKHSHTHTQTELKHKRVLILKTTRGVIRSNGYSTFVYTTFCLKKNDFLKQVTFFAYIIKNYNRVKC